MNFTAGQARGARGQLAVYRAALALLILAVFGSVSERGVAQQIPGVGADQLQQLQQMQSQGRGAAAPQGLTPEATILEPNAFANPKLPTSRLEQILSDRAGVKLKQFGYDQLGVGRAVTLPQMGAVQDDYVLGPGDEIVVSLRGQESAEYRVTVDRDGRVVLPRMSPVSASGRTLGDFRREMSNVIHRAYVSTEGFVSVGRLRQISILVSGEVSSPGVRTLTGLSTAVDAILVSGGVKKTGSLRNVYVLRGGQRISIDLYGVLTGDARTSHRALADGDRIVVPPLGPTAAVVGWVRRPGIYEIANGRSSTSVRELLSLAGGLEVRGKYRLSVLRLAPDGRNQMAVLEGQSGTVGDSEILFAQPAANQTTSQVTLSGGTALAGQYATKNTKLSDILKSPGALGDNPYTLFGIISRRDPDTLLRRLIPFTPVAILRGADDMNVQSDDVVRVLSMREAQILFTTVRLFEQRRASVDDAVLGVEDMTGPSAAAASAAQGLQTPGQQQNAMLFRPSSQDTASETEAASLVRVERALETLARQSNPVPLLGPNGQLYPPLNQNPNEQQYYNAQSGASDALGMNYSPQGPTGAPIPPNGTVQNGQYPPQFTTETSRQIGPYRGDPRLTGELPTLGQNLEEQSVDLGQIPTNQEVTSPTQLARQLQVDPVVFVNFLRDHKVSVGGAVRGAGLYLVGPDADIQSLLQAAGGLARWADKNAIEVISTHVDSNTATSMTERMTVSLADAAGAGYIVSPPDEVHVNQVFTDVGIGSVVVVGQIRNKGTYQIVRGEHLSDLLARAGGLTDSAYPYGTVFLRRSAAEREQDAYRREAKEIQDQLMIAMSRRDPNAKLAPDAFNTLQVYVNQLKYQKALGRVTIAADPAMLAANPALDPLLEAGDVVYIPQRPYSIAVLGEVLQPGSVPFRPELSASDFIDQAGGYSQFADKSETIVVLPDGSARRVESSWFNFGGDSIPPGSTIYVARDISGIDIHEIIVDTATIFSQLATSAAALAVLSKQ